MNDDKTIANANIVQPSETALSAVLIFEQLTPEEQDAVLDLLQLLTK